MGVLSFERFVKMPFCSWCGVLVGLRYLGSQGVRHPRFPIIGKYISLLYFPSVVETSTGVRESRSRDRILLLLDETYKGGTGTSEGIRSLS